MVAEQPKHAAGNLAAINRIITASWETGNLTTIKEKEIKNEIY